MFGTFPFRPGSPSPPARARSEEHTSELQSRVDISYAVFCLKKKIFDKKSEHFTQHRDHSFDYSHDRFCYCVAECNASDGQGLFFFNDTATTEIYTLSLHDALPI